MAKKYGSYGGGYQSIAPSKSSAPGSWSPVEVYRQIQADQFPKPILGAAAPVGTLVYAISSGVVDTSVATGNFLVPSGQNVNRSTYSALFNTLGTFYGAGDGATTFTLPNFAYSFETSLKYTTTSGLTAAQTLGSGNLPTHTHFVNGGSNFAGTGEGGPYASTSSSFTFNTSDDGETAGNAARRVYLTPLLATDTVSAPVGTVYGALADSNTNIILSIPNNAVVASGNLLSRSTNSELFSLVGTLWGSGDGSTTFHCPDLRGLFIGHPYPNLARPSGVPSVTGPAGYYPDCFARHKHTVTSIYGAGGSNYGGPSNPSTTITVPPSAAVTNAGLEHRPKNITHIFCLVVS